MKVLVIPSWYPEGNDSLLGIYHKEYTKALSTKIDTDMLYISRYGISDIFKYILSQKLEIDNEATYKVYKLKMLDLSKISYKLQMKLYTKKLEKLYKKYIKHNTIPDILHAEVTIPAGYAVTKLGKKYNIPVIVTEHSSNLLQYFKDNNTEYGKYVLDNARYSTVSNIMKKQLKDYTTNVDIIPNLVDTTVFNKKKTKHKKISLVTVSAFRIGKGINHIINAMDILVNKKNIDCHLDIVGDGYKKDEYIKLANDLNLDKHITFHGRKNKDEIAEILSHNDIYVVGSDYESFCIPGVEALASGLPVVSTKCYGPEEYLDNKCGILCNTKDPKDMADKIIEVSKKLNKYDIKYLRSVADRFSYDKVIDKALNIYKDMLKTE